MKTKYKLSTCVKVLASVASVTLALPLAALEKPSEKAKAKTGNEQAPKEKAGEADAAERKAPKPAEKIAMLGIGGNETSETLSIHLGLAVGTGLTVYHVVPGSAAAKAGLEAHDIITGVNEKNIGSQDDLRAAILAHKPGDEVTVKLIHKGKLEEKKVVLGERTPMPQAGVAPMQGMNGGANDLLKMLQGMAGNIPEADRDQMQKQMKKHFERMQKQLQNGGGIEFGPKGLRMGKGMQILGGTTITIHDGQGSVTMKTVNGKKEVIVTDKAGKVLFEGPYETEQDKAAVPDDVADRIKRVDVGAKGHGMRLKIGPGGVMPPPIEDNDEAVE